MKIQISKQKEIYENYLKGFQIKDLMYMYHLSSYTISKIISKGLKKEYDN
jgi:Mor family transcriptional regulator